MIDKEMKCPCGSGKAFGECCAPLISGEAAAKTAEALMRSRYSAYVAHEIDYIIDTCDASDVKEKIDRNATKKWSEESDWRSLQILRCVGGGEGDNAGEVEFEATYYTKNGKKEVHREIAEFAKKAGKWLYVKGRFADVEQVVRQAAKVGRNDPCPCGSGLKYKKCCGR